MMVSVKVCIGIACTWRTAKLPNKKSRCPRIYLVYRNVADRAGLRVLHERRHTELNFDVGTRIKLVSVEVIAEYSKSTDGYNGGNGRRH